MDRLSTQSLEPSKWVSSYKELLYHYTKGKISDKSIIEDLIQDTFLAGLKSQHLFKGEAKESTWLIAILRHKIIDYYRSVNSKKGQIKKNMISETDFRIVYNKEITLDTIDENETIRGIAAYELEATIKKGFEILSENELAVMQLKIEGHNTEAICDSVKISRENLWVTTCRARKKLRRYLDLNWLMVS